MSIVPDRQHLRSWHHLAQREDGKQIVNHEEASNVMVAAAADNDAGGGPGMGGMGGMDM